MVKNTYIILGYGRSGRESEKHLLSLGYKVIVYDDGQNIIPEINWSEIVGVAQSPGIPLSHAVSEAARASGISNKSYGEGSLNNSSTERVLLARF